MEHHTIIDQCHQIDILKSADKSVWSPGTSRIIPAPRQPQVSSKPIRYPSIKYRNLYYYSINEEFPYLELIKREGFKYPLVRCCSYVQYLIFINELKNNQFNGIDIEIVHDITIKI